MWSHIDNWLEERFKISIIKKVLGKKEVPQHSQSHWYYFGGVALFLFIVQIVTGLLLLVYYQPGIESSHPSVQYIMDKVEFGWLIRSIHSWAANLMVLVVFVHMFSAFFMKAYRAPREITWLTGFAIFICTLGLGFSGYLLPWDEISFFATKVGLEITGAAPIVGPFMADMLRGGESITGATISRFFELHVILLPAAIIGLLTLHLIMVQVHGMSKPYSYANRPKKQQKTISFFDEFLFHDIILWTMMMGVVIFIAYAFPWGLGPEADTFAPAPEGIKPEWYFMFMFQILKFLPAHIGPFEGEIFGILMFGVGALLWALVPFWEPINKTTSKLATAFGIFAVILIVSMTTWGYIESPEGSLVEGELGATGVSVAKQDGSALFKQNCSACHTIGGGALAGPDLKGVTDKDQEWLTQFILDPSGSAMPVIPGVDKQNVQAILDYIEIESDPEKAAAAAEEEKLAATQSTKALAVLEVKPFSDEEIENGRKLFTGVRPLANGGPSCMTCHSIRQTEEAISGGHLGNDLTHVYKKLGERKGLEGWLASLPNATMQPIYQAQSLEAVEITALIAFFEDTTRRIEAGELPKPTGLPESAKFILFGLGGMALVLVFLAMVYHGRLRGVRKPLVYGNNHESDEGEQ